MPHIALLGPSTLLDVCAPAATDGLAVTRIDGPPVEEIAAARPDAIVAFAPPEDLSAAIDTVEVPALLWWPDTPPAWARIAPKQGASRPRRTIVGRHPAPDGTWRSVAVPVADRLFAAQDAATAEMAPGAAWLGPPSVRREEYLRHFEHPAEIAEEGAGAGIAVNLRDDDRAAAEHRAHVALAQGRLLISEPLAPSRGLEPGIDFVEALALDDIHLAVENALRAPSSAECIRLRGRRKAELFRASAVVARLVGDLLLELDLAAAAS